MYQLTIADHHPIIKEGLQHILSDHDFIISNVVVDGKDLDASLEKVYLTYLYLNLTCPTCRDFQVLRPCVGNLPVSRSLSLASIPKRCTH